MALDESEVRAALQAELQGTADAEVLDYASSCLADDDLDWGDAAGGCAGAFDAVGAVLADAVGGDEAAVHALLVRLAARLQLADAPAAAAAAADSDSLLALRGIRLAFGGRTLLRPTDFTLRRGARYALVGGNGVGKTTLLMRVAAGDIADFPPALRRACVQHEVLARSCATALQFCREGGAEEAAAADALARVGFTPALCSALVSELSGGWRMRLALARSTLEQVDLLLLDEPTNRALYHRSAHMPARLHPSPQTWTWALLPGCGSTCERGCLA